MSNRADGRRDRSPRSDGSRPLYAPADSHGNFSSQMNDDARLNENLFDLDELELDPSERVPGGPVADAVHALPPSTLVKKWVLPLAAYLVACFLQSIALYSSTFLYVPWMDKLAQSLEMPPEASGVLRQIGNSTAHESVMGSFKLPDPFRDHFANSASSSPVFLLSYLAPLMPVLWAVIVVRSKNLRLWTRTLLVGTILALLKAFVAWVTVVPDSAGWHDCKAKLERDLLTEARGESTGFSIFWIFKAVFDVVWLWVANFFCGNHSTQSLVCSDGIVSGPVYINSLAALALYDAMRITTRKMKPKFRWIYRILVAFGLTVLVLQAAHVDLMSGRQYAADVTLAIVFSLLLYSNPTIAILVDRWLTSGSSSFALLAQSGQLKDPYDEGDVVVPLCCLPFCCVHGRYYLYTATVEEVTTELQQLEAREKQQAAADRQQAEKRAEQFQKAQQEGARRLLELETLMQTEQKRSEQREKEELEQAQKKYERAIAELKIASERRLAQGLADLEKQMKMEQEAVVKQDVPVGEKQQAAETDAQLDEKLRALKTQGETACSRVAEKRSELARLEEQAEQEKRLLEELETHKAQWEAENGGNH